MRLSTRNDTHLARRIWHFCGVISMVALYWHLDQDDARVVAVAVSAPLIFLDFLRLRWKRLNRLLTLLFLPFIRADERHKPAALSALMAGVTLIIFAFPKDVVLLALAMLAVADPMAGYIGVLYGKDRLVGNKTLQGFLAAFAASFVVALIYLQITGLMAERAFIVCLLAGLVGAFSELVPVGQLDDNFVFPVVSATGLTGLFYLFGGF